MSSPSDDTTTWMGHTLTHEFIRRMLRMGINPWLTVMFGREVRLSKNDPRRPISP